LVIVRIDANRGEVSPRSRNLRRGRKALQWGALGCVTAVLVALVGPLGLAAVLLLALVSPRAVRACRRRLDSLPRPTVAQLDALARSLASLNPTYVPFELVVDLRLLTDDQLEQAWRDTHDDVSSASDRCTLARAVEERGRYLAELERRHPSLLRAWLTSDAAGPDGVLPYATPSRSESAGIDWDELTGGRAAGP
jgi:hypothetical protein